MSNLKIKEQYKDLQIGYNNSGVPLGLRTDLHELAKIASDSNDEFIKGLFEDFPSEAAILEASGEAFIDENPPLVEEQPLPKNTSKSVSKS